MAYRQIIKQNNFRSGIVDEAFMGFEDTTFYQQGAKTINNFFISPEGTLTRRPGLRVVYQGISSAQGDNCRLISCQWGRTTGAFLLITPVVINAHGGILQSGTVEAYSQDGSRSIHGYHFWTNDIIKEIKSFDTAIGTLLCHEKIEPFLISADPDDASLPFQASTILWEHTLPIPNTILTAPLLPYETFDALTRVQVAAIANNRTTLTTNLSYFKRGTTTTNGPHVNCHIKAFGGIFRITEVHSSRSATANVMATPTSWIDATSWGVMAEQAFSKLRGYPRAGTFFQGRLILGGTPSLPKHVWASRVGRPFNFALNAGAASDGLSFNLSADEAEEVRFMVAGRYLEIYTNLAEWSCPIDTLTPTSIALVKQGRYGSAKHSTTLPVEGKTIFLGQDNKTIHQLEWSDIDKGYRHQTLNQQVKSYTHDIVRLHYDRANNLLYALRQDGTLAIMTFYSEQATFAWVTMNTPTGVIIDIAHGRSLPQADGSTTEQPYFLVKRTNNNNIVFTIETFDQLYHADGIIARPNNNNQLPLSHQGLPLVFMQNNKLMGMKQQTNATAALPDGMTANQTYDMGIKFDSTLTPLHRFSGPGGEMGFSAIKLNRLSLLVKDTPLLSGQYGDQVGPNHAIASKELAPSPSGNPNQPSPYSGWTSLALQGWHQSIKQPLWQLIFNHPYPATLLAAKEEFIISTPNPVPPNS